MKAPEQVLQALGLGTPVIKIIFFSIFLTIYAEYYGSIGAPVAVIIF